MIDRRFFAQMRHNLFAFYICLSLGGLSLFLFALGQTPKIDFSTQQTFPKKSTPLLSVNFSFLSDVSSFPFPDIDKTIKPLAVNTRPDRPLKSEMLIQVGDKPLKLIAGDRVYLTFHSGVEVSKEPTSFWVENRLDEKGIAMEVGVRVLENEKRRVFRFEDLTQDATMVPSQELKEAKLIGPDKLLELYGGRVYQKDKGKMRLKFPGGSLLFLNKGDRLSYQSGKWSFGMAEGLPLAEVIDLSPFEMGLKVWSSDGLSSEAIRLTMQKSSNAPPRPQALFTKLRKKTQSTVSCRLGQKPALIKKGDWLLRTKAGWRFITTPKEVEECLSLKLQGELFVCDGIDKNHLVGTLFDHYRTTTQTIRLPLGETKKQ